MARSNSENFRGGYLFPIASAREDPFYKEDVQRATRGLDLHDHSDERGLPVARLAEALTLEGGRTVVSGMFILPTGTPTEDGAVITKGYLDTIIAGGGGLPGPPGPRGATWHFGNGAPPDPIPGSQVGDLYLDMLTGNVYRVD